MTWLFHTFCLNFCPLFRLSAVSSLLAFLLKVYLTKFSHFKKSQKKTKKMTRYPGTQDKMRTVISFQLQLEKLGTKSYEVPNGFLLCKQPSLFFTLIVNSICSSLTSNTGKANSEVNVTQLSTLLSIFPSFSFSFSHLSVNCISESQRNSPAF